MSEIFNGKLPKMLLGDNIGEAIYCPRCGFDYNHPVRVIVASIIDGKKSCAISSEGVEVYDSGYQGRGVRIGIQFICEQCPEYTWQKWYTFYKGNVFVKTLLEQPLTASSDIIWRD